MFKFMNKIAHSYWYDLLGIAIVVLGCASMGYFGETLGNSSTMWKSGNAFMRLFPSLLPIGFISVISALFSLESDRFESRLSNVGNWIGIPSIVLTAFVDYAFGNSAAWLSYSVTMLIQVLAVYVWHVKGKYNVNKLSPKKFAWALIGATSFSLVFCYLIDVLGYGGFANAHGAIFWTSTLAFAVSMIANLAEMFKLQFNNKAWVVYNLIQLVKAFTQGNFANVYKILYYLVNNAVSIVSWSDKGRAISEKNALSKRIKAVN